MSHTKPLFSFLVVLSSLAGLGQSQAAPVKTAPVKKAPTKKATAQATSGLTKATTKPSMLTPSPGQTDVIEISKVIPKKTEYSGSFINENTRNDTPSETTLKLADDAGPKLPIIISSRASDSSKALAQELALYLAKITGALFTVKEGDGSRGIVIGSLDEFALPAFARTLALKDGFNGKEAYAIRTRPHKLMLIGATDLGTEHAVYRFLHEIGYRWFFPNPAWEVIPKISTLKFNRDITDRPAIWSRSIWFEAGAGTPGANELYRQWRRVNGQAESFVTNNGHNVQNIIAAFPDEFKAHPEYYGKTADGRILPEEVEWTNPAVRALIVEYARRFFKSNPNADMVSIEPANNAEHSQSPEALKTSFSDQVFGTANEVAQMLQKEFPGKMVGLYSYQTHWDPPSFPLEPNVHVQMSDLGSGKMTYAERDAIWPTLSKNRGSYQYYSVFLWNYDKLPGSWLNDVKVAQATIKKQVVNGITAISGESTSNWGLNGRGYYVATQMMWNPDQDLDALLDDFYTKAFGAGAPAMKKYFDDLDPANARVLSKHTIGMAFRDVDEAARLTAGQPDIEARLDFIKQYLRFAQLDWAKNSDGLTSLNGVPIDDEIAMHSYRIREEAITTWEMARQTLWSKKDWSGEAYNKPYTHEEIEKNFQDGLQFFPVRPDVGEAVTYSEDLVPVAWPGAVRGVFKAPEKISQAYQGAVRYGLYSSNGEPLDFTTEAGTMWNGVNRFSVTDAKGVEVAKGTLPNNQTTVHKIAVPHTGVYWLDYNDGGSSWTMNALPGKVSTIPLNQSSDFHNTAVTPQMYFYVPKGIKRIEYYYKKTNSQPGGPHNVLDPTGNVVKEVNVDADWVTVPVPPGMDGKLWSFQNPVFGFFWFNNLPNYYAATPDGLMIPREVALKDGLTIKH